jgi:hypothetical protein
MIFDTAPRRAYNPATLARPAQGGPDAHLADGQLQERHATAEAGPGAFFVSG